MNHKERKSMFQSAWLPTVEPGQTGRALVAGNGGPIIKPGAAWRTLSILPPGQREAAHPVVRQLVSHRWSSPELVIEARHILFSLWSSYREGWERQVELVKGQLLEVLDRDRVAGLQRGAQEVGVKVEHIMRAPVVDVPFKIAYQGSEWLVHPLESWKDAVPYEAHINKFLLEKAGESFDRWYIADELPRSTLKEQVQGGALLAGAASLVAVAAAVGLGAGLVTVLGTALAGLAALDPALVGILESRAEPGKAEWFIIARWLH